MVGDDLCCPYITISLTVENFDKWLAILSSYEAYNHFVKIVLVKVSCVPQLSKFSLVELAILGELCADESKRRLLPSKAWEILLQYFPKAVLFKAEAPACSICLVGVDLA